MTGHPDFSDNAPVSEPVTLGRRGAARARLALPARMMSFDGGAACTLIDASQSGAQIGASEPPPPGAMVVIEIRGHELEEMAGTKGFAERFGVIEFFGTVSWASKNRFGIAFDEEIDRDLVVILRQIADIMDRSGTRWARERAKEFVAGRN